MSKLLKVLVGILALVGALLAGVAGAGPAAATDAWGPSGLVAGESARDRKSVV